MLATTEPNSHPFVLRIESVVLVALSEAEKDALAALPMHVAEYDTYQDIASEHDRPGRAFAVLSGIVFSYKATQEGGRQIMAYHVAGDVPDFQSMHLEVLDFSLAAATPCRVGFVPHDTLRALCHTYPRLGDAFWRTTRIDGALAREWLLNIGQREAYPRLAHLFCELITRLKAVGLAHGRSCALPLSQAVLADAMRHDGPARHHTGFAGSDPRKGARSEAADALVFL